MGTATPQRILVLAIRAIGDVVLITPIIRILRQAFPRALLTVLANGASARVLQHNPHIDRVVEIDRETERQLSFPVRLGHWKRFFAQLRQDRFDTVIDLYSGPRSALWGWLSNARNRYGEDTRHRLRGFLYNHRVPVDRDGRHLIEQKLDVVVPLVGAIDRSLARLEVYVSNEEVQRARHTLSALNRKNPRLVGLVPGAGSPWRVWPHERYAELGNMLVKQFGVNIVLLGGEADRSLCESINMNLTEPSLDLSGQTSLRELVAVLAELDLVIANVTGPMHIASALDKPRVIGLYGAADTVQYAPWSPRAVMITKGKPQEAYWQHVDYERDYQRLLEITVADVSKTVSDVMKEWNSTES
ncbi:MAG: lipopolysaccharide heptosyltransferase II [Nitrospirales bacterium]|nr:lipopolysaccharide heptosyltransferase II [Nitrospira sp.]MDR4502405.1 lipopolysaccharide heptosyltransferase II [Nitrospirales bacterium]